MTVYIGTLLERREAIMTRIESLFDIHFGKISEEVDEDYEDEDEEYGEYEDEDEGQDGVKVVKRN